MKILLTHLLEPPKSSRQLQGDAVASLASSMARIGLRTPVAARPVSTIRDGKPAAAYEIVAGRHRIAAARKLGWTEIEATVIEDETDARLWEIAENLHRADLTVAERAECIAEWVRLTGERVSGQSVQKPHGGRPEGGVAQAARELPISGGTDEAKRKNVERAVKIAALAPEAKEAARQTGLDNNQSALLAAAKAEPAAQVSVLREIAERGAVKPAPSPLNDLETEEQWMGAIMRVWNRGAPQWRERFLETVDRPLFEDTRAGAAA